MLLRRRSSVSSAGPTLSKMFLVSAWPAIQLCVVSPPFPVLLSATLRPALSLALMPQAPLSKNAGLSLLLLGVG